MNRTRITWGSKSLSWLWLVLLVLLGATIMAWMFFSSNSVGAAPAADPGPQWVMDWNDEFNGASVDTTKWNIGDGHSGINNELAYYTPNNVSVSGGNLILVSKNNDQAHDGGGDGYTSGQVDTAGKYSFQYGRVEVRAMLPDGKGIWPAHWTLNSQCRHSQVTGGCRFWPPEIDILERINSEPNVYQTWHPETVGAEGFIVSGTTFATSFHTYEVEWDPGEIRFYVDGVFSGLSHANITSKSMLLILQTAIGGSWPGNPDQTTVFPQYHYIDYVRHYSYCPTCTPQATAQPTATLPPTLTPTVVPSGGTARVELGGADSYTDSGHNVWSADTGCTGGGGIVDRGNISISNTSDPHIYQTEHWGMTSCAYAVANGSYNVRLHFAETNSNITGVGQRIFSVNVEGQTLNNLDVFATTGGRNIALVETFSVNVTDGQLNVTFTPNVEQPLINGIEILPPGPTPTPGPTQTPTKTPTPTVGPSPTSTNTPAGPCTVNMALGQPVVVSGYYLNPGPLAVDGNTGTRWDSAYRSDPQWIYVDLGSVKSICRVVLNWHSEYATKYQVQVSNDASTWTDVYSTTAGNGGIDTITVSTSARYVRMYGTARTAKNLGYSLWEFEVY